MITICTICKSSFNKSRNSKFILCSKKCRNIYNRTFSKNAIEQSCLNCNKKFKTHKNDIKRGHGNFCSRSCSSKFTAAKQLSDPNNIVKCTNCKKDISRKKYHRDRNKAYYCSLKCFGKARRGEFYEENKIISRWNLIASTIKLLRGDKYQICNWDLATCDVHHIVPKHNGGTDEQDNLIILCPNHHRMADRKLIDISVING